jgi:hypothetical protein
MNHAALYNGQDMGSRRGAVLTADVIGYLKSVLKKIPENHQKIGESYCSFSNT